MSARVILIERPRRARRFHGAVPAFTSPVHETLGAANRIFRMKTRMRHGLLGVAVIAVATVAISSWPQPAATSEPEPLIALEQDQKYSNIRHEDYIGPEACGQCHEENYSSWSKHPHSRMNTLATEETIVGDFSGVSLDYGDGRVVFLKRDGAYLMEFYQGEKRIRTYRATRTIGWRYQQEYLGVQIEGPEPPDDPVYTSEVYLQFGYLLGSGEWLPQFYFNPEPALEYEKDGTAHYDPFKPESFFTRRCVFCHNTYSYDSRLYSDRTGAQSPAFAPIKALAEADGSQQGCSLVFTLPFSTLLREWFAPGTSSRMDPSGWIGRGLAG
jgi:hypothetical protein